MFFKNKSTSSSLISIYYCKLLFGMIIFTTALIFNIAQAQSVDYINSPLHRDLSNIANKIDQSNSATSNAVKGAVATSAIMSGLKNIGNALENEKFRDASESILKEGDWKLYQANTGLGALTVIYGSGKFAVLIK